PASTSPRSAGLPPAGRHASRVPAPRSAGETPPHQRPGRPRSGPGTISAHRRAEATTMTQQLLALPAVETAPDFSTGSIFFVGTATVVIRYAGFTILTDPNLLHKGDHVHLGYGMHAERLTEPALSFETLPPFDFVLLSHMHGDHFDHIVSERLGR